MAQSDHTKLGTNRAKARHPAPAGAPSPEARARSEVVRGYSLPRYYYTSQDRYEMDIRILRDQHWLLVDHASSLPSPGDFVVRNCAGESIILVRDQADAIRAFFNVCRHRGSVICKEEHGSARTFVCPYHAWTYGLDGALRTARAMPPDFDAEMFGLVPCNVGVVRGLIFVNMATGAPPAFDSFSHRFEPFLDVYGIGDAKVGERMVFPVDANWKGVVENLGECYHCTPAHPAYARAQVVGHVPLQHDGEWTKSRVLRDPDLARLLPTFSDTPEDVHFQGAGYHEIGRGRRTVSVGGNLTAPPMGAAQTLDGLTAGMVFNPLSFLISFPDYSLFATHVPRSAVRTDIEMTWLVAGSAVEGTDYDRGTLRHLWAVTTEEDRRIISDNQTGISSDAYRPGPYSLDESKVVDLLDWYMNHFVDVD